MTKHSFFEKKQPLNKGHFSIMAMQNLSPQKVAIIERLYCI